MKLIVDFVELGPMCGRGRWSHVFGGFVPEGSVLFFVFGVLSAPSSMLDIEASKRYPASPSLVRTTATLSCGFYLPLGYIARRLQAMMYNLLPGIC